MGSKVAERVLHPQGRISVERGRLASLANYSFIMISWQKQRPKLHRICIKCRSKHICFRHKPDRVRGCLKLAHALIEESLQWLNTGIHKCATSFTELCFVLSHISTDGLKEARLPKLVSFISKCWVWTILEGKLSTSLHQQAVVCHGERGSSHFFSGCVWL